MANVIDLTGRDFNRWHVLIRAENSKEGRSRWSCRCQCGTEKTILGKVLLNGHSQSCGCLNIEKIIARSTKHGHSRPKNESPTYRIWKGMMSRCYNPRVLCYARYGGRGITICKRWHDFRNFLRDMGERPPGLTIERKNNSRNYSPKNCCWATFTEQARNTRKNRFLTFKGETRCISEWAEHLNIDPTTLSQRLARGKSIEEVLSPLRYTPKRKERNRHLLTFRNETRRITEWARLLNRDRNTIASRLQLGWSVEDALSLPTRKRRLV
jgi:hypothetical protein